MSTYSKFKASLYDKRLFVNIFSSIFLAKILTKMNECLFKNTSLFFSFLSNILLEKYPNQTSPSHPFPFEYPLPACLFP